MGLEVADTVCTWISLDALHVRVRFYISRSIQRRGCRVGHNTRMSIRYPIQESRVNTSRYENFDRVCSERGLVFLARSYSVG